MEAHTALHAAAKAADGVAVHFAALRVFVDAGLQEVVWNAWHKNGTASFFFKKKRGTNPASN